MDANARDLDQKKFSTINMNSSLTSTEPKMMPKDEVYRLVGCAMGVLNELAHGFNEKPYQDAMAVEFGLLRIPTAFAVSL